MTITHSLKEILAYIKAHKDKDLESSSIDDKIKKHILAVSKSEKNGILDYFVFFTKVESVRLFAFIRGISLRESFEIVDLYFRKKILEKILKYLKIDLDKGYLESITIVNKHVFYVDRDNRKVMPTWAYEDVISFIETEKPIHISFLILKHFLKEKCAERI